MNAKVKLMAALAAAQMVVPMVFAQPPTVVVPRGSVVIQQPGPVAVSVPSVFYEITGRITELTPNRIVVRS